MPHFYCYTICLISMYVFSFSAAKIWSDWLFLKYLYFFQFNFGCNIKWYSHRLTIFFETWRYEVIRSLMFRLRFAERGRNTAGMAAFSAIKWFSCSGLLNAWWTSPRPQTVKASCFGLGNVECAQRFMLATDLVYVLLHPKSTFLHLQ